MKIAVTCMCRYLTCMYQALLSLLRQPKGGRIYLDHGSKNGSIHHDMEDMAMQASIRGKGSL